jgi:DNA-binding HxlR family transcriptional regulator
MVDKLKKHSEATKQKISRAMAGRIVSEETKQKQSISHRGRSRTGLVNQTIVERIRDLFRMGIAKKQIYSSFPQLTPSTINDIIAERTWKK